MFAPQALPLGARVVLDALNDLLDVGAAELGDAALCVHAHGGHELLVRQRQRAQHLKRRRRHAALVGRSVLDQQHAVAFEPQTRQLGEEEVGALHHRLEARLARGGVVELLHVGDLDGLGAATARHEQRGRRQRVEVEVVAKIHAAGHQLAVGQLDVVLCHQDAETAGAQQLGVEMLNLPPGTQ